jgi:hypothetical protein
VLLLGAGALGAIVGPALAEQNSGDWAVVVGTLTAGAAALAVGVYLARR